MRQMTTTANANRTVLNWMVLAVPVNCAGIVVLTVLLAAVSVELNGKTAEAIETGGWVNGVAKAEIELNNAEGGA